MQWFANLSVCFDSQNSKKMFKQSIIHACSYIVWTFSSSFKTVRFALILANSAVHKSLPPAGVTLIRVTPKYLINYSLINRTITCPCTQKSVPYSYLLSLGFELFDVPLCCSLLLQPVFNLPTIKAKTIFDEYIYIYIYIIRYEIALSVFSSAINVAAFESIVIPRSSAI